MKYLKYFEKNNDWSEFYNINKINYITESNEFENFMESLSLYLEELYEKGIDNVGQFIKMIFKRFRLKNKILAFTLSILVLKLGCNLTQLISYINVSEEEKKELVSSIKVNNEVQAPKKNINHFLNDIAEKESSGNPNIINSLGYIGKYQFGKLALKELGLDNKITTDKFRENPKIWPEHQQDKAMIRLIKKNINYLGKYINKYNGKYINGIKITKSGMIAGCHLLGASNVKKYLDSNGKVDPKDGYGTKLSDYLKNFSGYKIDI